VETQILHGAMNATDAILNALKVLEVAAAAAVCFNAYSTYFLT